MSDTLDTHWKFVQRGPSDAGDFRRGEIVSFLDSGVGGTPPKEVSYGLITNSGVGGCDGGFGHIWVLTDRDHRKFSTYWFIEGMQGKILQ